MAKGEERRMLFDIRGRRRHVIKIVYAVLALLMGTSLFLVVGPFNLGEVVNTGGASSATEALEDQVERIEARAKAEPENENLLLALSRAQINTANSMAETNPQTGLSETPPEARPHLKQGVQAWDRYAQEAEEPNPGAAAIVAGAYFRLAETSETVDETERYISEAAETQAVAAQARPTVGSLSTLAIYSYFDGDFQQGDRAKERMLAIVPKSQRKGAKEQMAQYRSRGKAYNKQVDRLTKAQQGEGKEAFERALGGLSLGGGGTLGP